MGRRQTVLASVHNVMVSLVFLLVFLVAPLSAILSALTTSSATFRGAKSSQLLWVLLPWFLGFIAAGYYWSFVFPRLRATKNQ
jgi:uncharacterized oligopeptide transporter (OPT) family protein